MPKTQTYRVRLTLVGSDESPFSAFPSYEEIRDQLMESGFGYPWINEYKIEVGPVARIVRGEEYA